MALIQTGMFLTPAVLGRLGPLGIRKTSSESISADASYHSDAQLVLPVEASAMYFAHLHLVYTGVTAAGLRLRLSVPSGTSAPAWTLAIWNGTSVDVTMTAGATGIAATGATDTLEAWGPLVVDATAGNVTVQWGQSTSNAGNTTVNSNSILTLWRIS